MFDFKFITLFLFLSVSVSSHSNQLCIFPTPSIRLGAPQVQRLDLFIFIFIFLAVLGLQLRMGFLQLWLVGATLCCVAWASHCGGFSLLRSTGSRRAGFSSCGTRVLERRLSSCGTRALLLRGMWDTPGPGIKPVSPALAGRFLTTAPPGKSPETGSFYHYVFSTLSSP